MDYELKRNIFSKVKNITWEDIIDKISFEFSLDEIIARVISNDLNPPTFVLPSNYFPNSINIAYEEVCSETKNQMEMHLYTSFAPNSDTFGRHNDDQDVLIVQSIGIISYSFDDGSKVTLIPGDSLFIKKGVYHNPIVYEPRATLSFSWS